MRDRGFTFLEIMMILLSLAILSGITIPRFISFRREAKLAVEKQNAASVRKGIAQYYIESVTRGRTPLYPPVLDQAGNTFASSENPFFTLVLLPPGVTERGWRKLNNNVYQGFSGTLYFYDPNSGNFTEQTLLSDEIMSLLGFSNEDITLDLLNQISTQDRIIFPDGRELIGASVVLVPRQGREPAILAGTDTQAETFSFSQGNLTAQITGEYAGYANRITFGYYTIEPQTGTKVLHQIFSGPDSTGTNVSFSLNPAETAGFYFTTPQHSGYTYYSETDSNPDNLDHIRVYQNETVEKITVACEDLLGGGDGDFQDFIVTISY